MVFWNAMEQKKVFLAVPAINAVGNLMLIGTVEMLESNVSETKVVCGYEMFTTKFHCFLDWLAFRTLLRHFLP